MGMEWDKDMEHTKVEQELIDSHLIIIIIEELLIIACKLMIKAKNQNLLRKERLKKRSLEA